MFTLVFLLWRNYSLVLVLHCKKSCVTTSPSVTVVLVSKCESIFIFTSFIRLKVIKLELIFNNCWLVFPKRSIHFFDFVKKGFLS